MWLPVSVYVLVQTALNLTRLNDAGGGESVDNEPEKQIMPLYLGLKWRRPIILCYGKSLYAMRYT